MSLLEITFIFFSYLFGILFVLGLVSYIMEGVEMLKRFIKTGSFKAVDKQLIDKLFQDQQDYYEWLNKQGYK